MMKSDINTLCSVAEVNCRLRTSPVGLSLHLISAHLFHFIFAKWISSKVRYLPRHVIVLLEHIHARLCAVIHTY